MLSISPQEDKEVMGLLHSCIMIELVNLNADIVNCTRCPRLVTYREAVAQQKKR